MTNPNDPAPAERPFSFAEHFTEQEKNPAHWKELLSLTQSELASLREEVARLKSENMCDVCAGSGIPASGEGCVCNGTGKACHALNRIREMLFDADKERDKLRAENEGLRHKLDKSKKCEAVCQCGQLLGEHTGYDGHGFVEIKECCPYAQSAMELKRENEELRADLNRATSTCVCAYCKKEIPKNTDEVMLHMQECDNHPLGDALRAEVALKEMLQKCETEFGQMAKEADKQVAELSAENARLSQTVESMRSALASVAIEHIGAYRFNEGTGMMDWISPCECPTCKAMALAAAPATGCSTEHENRLDRALTIQQIQQEKAAKGSRALDVSEDEIKSATGWVRREEMERALRPAHAAVDAQTSEVARLRARLDRMPADWMEDSSLETWFPFAAKEISDLRAKLSAAESALEKEVIHGAESNAAHQGIQKRLADRLEAAEETTAHVRQWYASRFEPIKDWARKTLPESGIQEFFCIIFQLNLMRHERDAARAELATLLALCESFHREATLSGGQPRTPTAPASA